MINSLHNAPRRYTLEEKKEAIRKLMQLMPEYRKNMNNQNEQQFYIFLIISPYTPDTCYSIKFDHDPSEEETIQCVKKLFSSDANWILNNHLKIKVEGKIINAKELLLNRDGMFSSDYSKTNRNYFDFEKDGFEPLIHSDITDCLPENHPLAYETIYCKSCGEMIHCGNNECMQTWVEIDLKTYYCLNCFNKMENE